MKAIDVRQTHAELRGTAARIGMAALVAGALAIGCAAPVRVNTMAAPGASFANRPTWAWNETAGGEVARSVAGQYIQQAVAQQLAAKGYQMAAVGQASFWMDYRVVLRQEASLEGFGGGWGGGSLQTVHYTRGTMLIAATDPATGNALWQGVASTVIDPDGASAADGARINEVVAKTLQSFPAR
jgi:hypothetical protein